MCTAASTGIVATVTNNGSGSYTIRKLVDGNCYVDMGVKKMWFDDTRDFGDVCAPNNSIFPACNTCYAISNNNDWYLPPYEQYNSLAATIGNSGSQLYTALGLSENKVFWSSSLRGGAVAYAMYMTVNINGVGIYYSYKSYANDVLCAHN
jgi:hypothetical protein